jgi:hypothetical protein
MTSDSIRNEYATHSILVASALVFLLFQVRFWHVGLDGDQPNTMMTVIAILHGHLNVYPGYVEHAYLALGFNDLRPQIPPVNGFVPPEHGIGFPLLVAPVYALFGLHGVKVFLLAFAALALPLLSWNCTAVGLSRLSAALAVLALALSEPWEVHAGLVLPEALAGTIVIAILASYLRFEQTKSAPWAFMVGTLTTLLPIIYLKYSALAVASGVLWLANRKLRRSVATYAAAPLLIAYSALWASVYGLSISKGTGASPTEFSVSYLWPHIVYAFVDRQHGEFVWAPVAALSLAGLVVWNRKARVVQAYLVALMALYAVMYGANQLQPGSSWPGRYLLADLPAMIALAAIAILQPGNRFRVRAAVFCLFVAGSGVIMYGVIKHGQRNYMRSTYAELYPRLYYPK